MARPERPDRPFALTMGEPAGIGPVIAALAYRQSKRRSLPPFVFLGDPDIFPAHNLDIPTKTVKGFDEALEVFETALPVLEIKLERKVYPGRPEIENAKAVFRAIEMAAQAALAGKAAGVVTNPITKKTLHAAGVKHPGHTTLFGELCRAAPVMMLANPDLRTVPVTVHIPLKDVTKSLTEDLIVKTAEIVAAELETRFGFNNPRLAVTGLNPHAGEDGLLGSEDQKIIQPAIAQLKKQGIAVEGPLPADTAFTKASRMRFDAFLAMTHDQALIPVKTLDFRKTVNITLGLPVIRTSPAHGTAFDVLLKGATPDPESLIQALLTAGRLAK